jgi:hypothetical protein
MPAYRHHRIRRLDTGVKYDSCVLPLLAQRAHGYGLATIIVGENQITKPGDPISEPPGRESIA